MHKVKHLDLPEKVYQALKNMILNGDLKSGEKLNQEKLARELGVSRTPILSAFSKLEKEVLVEIIPRKGTYIKKLNKKELLDLYDIRARLEPLGAYEAAKYSSENDLNQLGEIIDNFRSNLTIYSPKQLSKIDYDFHMAVMKMSKNDLLLRLLSSFNIIILSNLEGLLKNPKRSLKEHIELYQAIEEGNAELAEKIMHQHIMDSKGKIKNKFIK